MAIENITTHERTAADNIRIERTAGMAQNTSLPQVTKLSPYQWLPVLVLCSLVVSVSYWLPVVLRIATLLIGPATYVVGAFTLVAAIYAAQKA
jgi:hypothetical protein